MRSLTRHVMSVIASITSSVVLEMPPMHATGGDGPPVRRSRGDRRYTVASKKLPKPSKYLPHQGAQECARRRAQLAEGKLNYG